MHRCELLQVDQYRRNTSPRPGDRIHTPALVLKALFMNTALGLCKVTAGYQWTEGKQRHSASKISLSIPLNFSILKSWNAANRKLCFAFLYFNRAQHGLTWAKSERRPKEKLGQECWSTSDLTGCPQWASDGMCSSGSLYCWYSSSVDKQKHLILEADKQTSFIRAKTDTLQSNVQLSLILIRKLPFDFNFREMISSHVAKQ